MYKRLILLFLCFVATQTFAASIVGLTKDAATGETLPGVVINIKNTAINGVSNDSGRFELKGLKNGTYELEFNYPTYKKLVKSVVVKSNQEIDLEIRLVPEGQNLKEVTVQTVRRTNTDNAVMNEIRMSNSVASGISAATISKTMDRNAADVVKRIPGVTIIEDRFIVVRGLPDRYNSVWLNNAGAPSSETDKKSFSFDLIPSGLIDRILVYKTASPDLPGDFAGGMVKVFTASIPDRNQISVGFQRSYRNNPAGKTFNYNEPSKTDWLGYDDDKRRLPLNTPEYISKNDDNDSLLSQSFGNDWIIKQKNVQPDFRANLSVSNVVKIKKVQIGNTFGVAYSNLNVNYKISRQEWDSVDIKSGTRYTDIRSENKASVGLIDNIGVLFGGSKIEFKNLYNQTGLSHVTIRESVPDSGATPELAYAMGYESKATYATQLLGTHKFFNDRTQYNWALGYTDLFKNEPDLKRIKYNYSELDSTYKTPIASAVDLVNGGGRFYARLTEHTYCFNHQLTQKFNVGDHKFEVSAGNYLEKKERSYGARQIGYTIRTGARAQELTRLPINEIFADSNVGGKKEFKLDEATSKDDKYNATNELKASFLSLKASFWQKITIQGGVRYEQNKQSLGLYKTIDTAAPVMDIVTKFWLPSVNLSYNFTDKMLVRAAYSKTLNRPEFREMAPSNYYNFEFRSVEYGSLYQSLAAPNGDTLDVAQIQNYDLRWEWYPSPNEMIHVGAFYKSFKDPITKAIQSSSSDGRYNTYINAEDGFARGIEIDARKNLMFLDDLFNTTVLKDFVVVANLALVKSEMNIDTAKAKNNLPKTAFQGQSPYVVNAGLYYQNDTLGIQASVLYNVFGPRMILLGQVGDFSIGEMPFKSLDVVLSKTFFKHYTINFGIQNLLDQTVLLVQDTDGNGQFDPKKDKSTREYKPGRYISIGLKVKF